MKREHKILAGVILAGFVFWAIGKVAVLWADYLWFGSVGYASVFRTVLASKALLGAGVFVVVAAWLAGNALLASKLSPGMRLDLQEVHPWLTPPRVARLVRVVSALVIVAVALGLATAYAGEWYNVRKFLHRTPFDWRDPVLDYDASWYIFVLPVLEQLQHFIALLTGFGLVAAGAAYFVGGAIGTRYIRMTRAATRHVAALGGIFFLAIAWGYWLGRFGLLLRPGGTVYGVGWTDAHIRIPVYNLLTVVAVGTAVSVALAGWLQKKKPALIGAGVLVGMHVVAAWIVPSAAQALKVNPNELELEAPYLAHNIAATQYAFGLDEVEVQEYPAREQLTAEQVADSPGTIKNIRLWDYRVLQDTYVELQGLRTYYHFNEADVDRYRLDGDYRQVSLAVRELYHQELDPMSRTWVNEHLVYTHGYGLVLNPVNRVDPDGTPEFWVRDIPPRVKEGIPLEVTRPEIYFGETTSRRGRRRGRLRHGYVFVRTTEREFDYPLGDVNKQARYEGTAGVPVNSFLRKLLFAYYFGDRNVLFTTAFTEETKVLWRRHVRQRIATLAPFLVPDQDPYPVLHNGRIVWIVDLYTKTFRFPYSANVGHTDPRFRSYERLPNYIRNSVKAVVDAYDGTVRFYVVDPSDPLVATARKIFPDLFRDLEGMPEGLRKHLRYPLYLFNTQAERYMAYHMEDPQVFYNKEDLWERPQEFKWDRARQRNVSSEVNAYYVIMTLPGETEPEYLLMLPFTPRNKNNMVGWMAGRCDDEHYGKLLVFQFPKGEIVQGPSQIEARVDKTDSISRQITLWDQMGSRVIRGNLLVIPIRDSVLYVEPLYLDSEQTPFPELKRVIVATKDRLAMRNTLAEALEAVFGEAAPAAEPTVPPSPLPPKGDVANLAAEADRLFQEARRRQRDGDWAGYGETMDRLAEILQQLAEKAGVSDEPPPPENP